MLNPALEVSLREQDGEPGLFIEWQEVGHNGHD
jgi:hypothetical protein